MVEKKRAGFVWCWFYWFLIYLVLLCGLFYFHLLYQNGERKNLTCHGRGYRDMQQCVYFICLTRDERKTNRTIRAHQWSLNLVGWCLSHWSMIMISFVLWTVFRYPFFSVMLSSLNNGDAFMAQCLCCDFTRKKKNGPCFISDSIPSLFLFVWLFLYIFAVPEWQNILNVSHYVAVAQEKQNNSYDNNNKKREHDKNIQVPFSWWSSVLLYCYPWRKEKKQKPCCPALSFSQKSNIFVQTVQFCVCVFP